MMPSAGCPTCVGQLARRTCGSDTRENSSAPVRLLVLLAFTIAVLAGCTLTVPLAKPGPSQFQYTERREDPVTVVVQDARPVAERTLHKGRGTVEFQGTGEDLSFVQEALVAEMKARGLNAVAGTGDGTNVLLIASGHRKI